MKKDITSQSKLSPTLNNKRFIIYTPRELQQEISIFIQDKLKLSKPLLCSTFPEFKKNWEKDNKSIVITTIYHRTDPKIDKKMTKLFQETSSNVILVNSNIDLNSQDSMKSLNNSITFFDDVSRPLNTVVLSGISHTEYYGQPHEGEIGECYIRFKLITPNSKIEPGFIYGYKFDGEDIQSYAIIYESNTDGYYRIVPDRKITKQIEGSFKSFYKIPRPRIRLNSKLYFEVWRF